MLTRLALSVVVALSVAAVAASAQTPPGPSPGHKRLEAFVGKWTAKGEVKPISGPAGPITSTSTCEWYAGAYHVVCRSEASTPEGSVTETEVFGYEPAEDVYTRYHFSSDGSAALARGKLIGNTWDWRGGGKMGDTNFEVRFPWTMTSPDTMTFKVEIAAQGLKPQLVMEGTTTRVK